MFHPSRCITYPFLTDEAIRRRNTNSGEMGLAICCPPHTTERDKLEEILKQKEGGTEEEGAAFYIVFSEIVISPSLFTQTCCGILTA